MSKKIRITESQLEMVINNLTSKKPLKEEAGGLGMSVLLGVSSLMGIKLTGFNEKVSKEALNDPKTLNKIKNYLESDRIKDLASGLEELGMANALDRIESDAYEIQKKFNDIAFDIEGVTGGLAINLDD